MQARTVNLAPEEPEQRGAHRRVNQITEDRGHRHRPVLGGHHRKGEARQHRESFDGTNLVKLKLLLHQRAELLAMRDNDEGERQRSDKRCQIRVMEHARDKIA